MFELNIVGNFPTDDTGMFDQKDTTLINSLTWQERVRKLYANCPVPLNLTVIGENLKDYIEVFSIREDITNRLEAVAHTERNSPRGRFLFKNYMNKLGLTPKPDMLNIYLTNNEATNNRIPLTPWTLGHRAAHAIWGIIHPEFIPELAEAIHKFVVKTIDIRQREGRITGSFSLDRYAKIFTEIGTFRSCREGMIRSDTEFLMECTTQYLISGWVDLITPEGMRNDEVYEWMENLHTLNTEVFPRFFEGKIGDEPFYAF